MTDKKKEGPGNIQKSEKINQVPKRGKDNPNCSEERTRHMERRSWSVNAGARGHKSG